MPTASSYYQLNPQQILDELESRIPKWNNSIVDHIAVERNKADLLAMMDSIRDQTNDPAILQEMASKIKRFMDYRKTDGNPYWNNGVDTAIFGKSKTLTDKAGTINAGVGSAQSKFTALTDRLGKIGYGGNTNLGDTRFIGSRADKDLFGGLAGTKEKLTGDISGAQSGINWSNYGADNGLTGLTTQVGALQNRIGNRYQQDMNWENVLQKNNSKALFNSANFIQPKMNTQTQGLGQQQTQNYNNAYNNRVSQVANSKLPKTLEPKAW